MNNVQTDPFVSKPSTRRKELDSIRFFFIKGVREKVFQRVGDVEALFRHSMVVTTRLYVNIAVSILCSHRNYSMIILLLYLYLFTFFHTFFTLLNRIPPLLLHLIHPINTEANEVRLSDSYYCQ